MNWQTTEDIEQALAWNKAKWNEVVEGHWASQMYQTRAQALRAGGHGLDAHIAEGVLAAAGEGEPRADLSGMSAIHLQCHMGMETLSLERFGADAVGLDFARDAIAKAELLRDELQLHAQFICADVYDAVARVGPRAGTFDLVFVSIGSLCWLPDMTRWARTVSDLLRPGGFLFLNDVHPMTLLLDDHKLPDGSVGEGFVARWPYFGREGVVDDCAGSYVDGDVRAQNTRSVEWPHPFSEIITALLDAGMQLTRFDESPRFVWPAFSLMQQVGPHEWALNEPWRDALPGEFTIVARKG